MIRKSMQRFSDKNHAQNKDQSAMTIHPNLNELSEFVSTQLANPRASPLAIVFGAFGFVIAQFALALHRQASLARKWPVVSGTIKLSGIEQYRSASTNRTGGQVMYQRKVSYSYSYNDVSYTNMHAP